MSNGWCRNYTRTTIESRQLARRVVTINIWRRRVARKNESQIGQAAAAKASADIGKDLGIRPGFRAHRFPVQSGSQGTQATSPRKSRAAAKADKILHRRATQFQDLY